MSQSHYLGLTKVFARMLLRSTPVLRHSLPTAGCQELLQTPTSNADQPKSVCVGQHYRLNSWLMSPTVFSLLLHFFFLSLSREREVTHLVMLTVFSLLLHLSLYITPDKCQDYQILT